MALTKNQISSSDFLFHYKEIPNEQMAEYEIALLLNQPSRSLFYFRQFGTGIQDYENQPNSTLLQISVRNRIANSVNYRNLFVTDGTNNTIDRRIATSMAGVNFKVDRENLDVEVWFFLYEKYSDIRKMRAKIGDF